MVSIVATGTAPASLLEPFLINGDGTTRITIAMIRETEPKQHNRTQDGAKELPPYQIANFSQAVRRQLFFENTGRDATGSAKSKASPCAAAGLDADTGDWGGDRDCLSATATGAAAAARAALATGACS